MEAVTATAVTLSRLRAWGLEWVCAIAMLPLKWSKHCPCACCHLVPAVTLCHRPCPAGPQKPVPSQAFGSPAVRAAQGCLQPVLTQSCAGKGQTLCSHREQLPACQQQQEGGKRAGGKEGKCTFRMLSWELRGHVPEGMRLPLQPVPVSSLLQTSPPCPSPQLLLFPGHLSLWAGKWPHPVCCSLAFLR